MRTFFFLIKITCLDDIYTVNSRTFLTFVAHIYRKELTLNKDYITSDMCQFLDLDIPLFQGKYKIRVYDKREDFSFPIVNFPCEGYLSPISPAYGVYFFSLVRFALKCDNFSDINHCNLVIQK
jgi:hypothetical protein